MNMHCRDMAVDDKKPIEKHFGTHVAEQAVKVTWPDLGETRTKPLTRSYCLIEIEHRKDIPDLTDVVAQRIYNLDQVENTTAMLLTTKESLALAMAQTRGTK